MMSRLDFQYDQIIHWFVSAQAMNIALLRFKVPIDSLAYVASCTQIGVDAKCFQRASMLAGVLQVVVSDVPHCGACKYAAEHGIPIVRYPATHESAVQSKEHNAENPAALRDLLLHRHSVDFVILAGYLKVWYFLPLQQA